jgi:thiamine-monophosphate kinase
MREFALLKHVYGANASLPSRVTIPPGDDMGAVRVAGDAVLVTVDQIADGVHFQLATTPLAKIARKAITRNLSDVAAMAARPIGGVVAACLPRHFGEARATELFDHMRRVGDVYDCPLFGGDVTIWDHPLLLSVTVLAEPDGIEPVLRRGAKVGDVICVTGHLGGSLETVNGYTHHLDFEPRLVVARKLASNPMTRPFCMIDLSDGLARDLGHLCDATGVAAVIDAAALPVDDATRAAARRDGRAEWEHAVGDGEDYELCFTVRPERAAHLPAEIDGVVITRISQIVPGDGEAAVRVRLPDGTVRPVQDLGWEHRGA